MRRFGWVAALLGVVAVEAVIADAYYVRGTWWHWLLHQDVGWGLGLAVGALLSVKYRRRIPALPALLLGQLVSIFPDLMFRFDRVPHRPYMDVWVGHLSLHRGPSPLLVATGVLVLGGLGWLLVGSRPRLAVGVALAGPALLLAACLAAKPIPHTLRDYPSVSSLVVPR